MSGPAVTIAQPVVVSLADLKAGKYIRTTCHLPFPLLFLSFSRLP